MFRPFLILTHPRHVLGLDEAGTPELPKPPGLWTTLPLTPPHTSGTHYYPRLQC